MRLLSRAFGILKLHYFMLCTISFPLAFIFRDVGTVKEDFGSFVVSSILLLNQVALLHILPTFYPFVSRCNSYFGFA